MRRRLATLEAGGSTAASQHKLKLAMLFLTSARQLADDVAPEGTAVREISELIRVAQKLVSAAHG